MQGMAGFGEATHRASQTSIPATTAAGPAHPHLVEQHHVCKGHLLLRLVHASVGAGVGQLAPDVARIHHRHDAVQADAAGHRHGQEGKGEEACRGSSGSVGGVECNGSEYFLLRCTCKQRIARRTVPSPCLPPP